MLGFCKALPGYAYLSVFLGVAVVLLSIVSVLGYRHYKLEAEITSMTWKVNWNDVISGNPNVKPRGSLHSLAKRGSQLVCFKQKQKEEIFFLNKYL